MYTPKSVASVDRESAHVWLPVCWSSELHTDIKKAILGDMDCIGGDVGEVPYPTMQVWMGLHIYTRKPNTSHVVYFSFNTSGCPQ